MPASGDRVDTARGTGPQRLAYFDSSTAQLLQVHNHAAGIIAGTATTNSVDGSCHRRKGALRLARLQAHLYENGAEYLEAERLQSTGGYLLSARKGFASVTAEATYLVVWASNS